jgi:hypothetical protein
VERLERDRIVIREQDLHRPFGEIGSVFVSSPGSA